MSVLAAHDRILREDRCFPAQIRDVLVRLQDQGAKMPGRKRSGSPILNSDVPVNCP